MGLREQNKNKRYNSIIKTAEHLFIQTGPERVQMQDIADQEEIGIATLFRYFPKKDKLIVAAAVSIMEKEYTQFEILMNRDTTAIGKLELIFNHLIHIFLNPSKDAAKFIDSFESYAANSAEPLEDIDLYYAARGEISELFTMIIQEGKEDGSIRDDINTKENIVSIINSFGLFTRKLTVTNTASFFESDVESLKQLEIMKEIYLSYVKT
ncbi:TetR/AcrR family transcriptional regulator [Virgibacillus ihumii]|uniref:TetR/AcrR family transcriptional regulator n=1 Tax=Virgibacillus ihumii TaxID=2686091 RepID=UPI00157D8D64|nr:TetR/AcrR family transcriptional regulator [Virgibacillus ihumii]